MYTPIEEISPASGGFERLTSRRLSDAFHDERLELETFANRPQPFGKITNCRLSSIEMLRSEAAPYNYPFCVNRDTRSCRNGGQNGLFLIAVLSSQLSCEIGSRCYTLAEGDVVFIDSEPATRMEFSGGFDALWVRLPEMESHARRVLFQDAVDRKFDGRDGIMHVLLRTLLATYESANSIAPATLPLLERSLLDLIAAAISGSFTGVEDRRTTTYSRATFHRITSHIRGRLHDETITPSSIASEVGISVRRLNELFAQCDTTVTAWIVAERLERCRNRLNNKDWIREAIGRIAYEEGFKNISHFNRVFKKKFGESPGQMRSRVQRDGIA